MKIVLILAALISCFYLYRYLNEKHMESVTLKRAEELKQTDPLEFNRSLYKVQAARQRIKEQLQNKGKEAELRFNIPQNQEALKTQETVKELKKDEPSIPTPPPDQENYIDQQNNNQYPTEIPNNQEQQGEGQ